MPKATLDDLEASLDIRVAAVQELAKIVKKMAALEHDSSEEVTFKRRMVVNELHSAASLAPLGLQKHLSPWSTPPCQRYRPYSRHVYGRLTVEHTELCH